MKYDLLQGAFWACLLGAGLVAGAMTPRCDTTSAHYSNTKACASDKPLYNCHVWRTGDTAAKRDYCFPDCPSCGPALDRH